ncbi:hypothetical protein RGQ15_10750 [Paracoccus sp. MBLB3053]|uniref:Uncharacterized protein n=1 Tax=Paracoccus aurantius TaxID=3073814 RepID=A0ABU2HSL9_9RHOB|nr:hypothetical protein [Paracoccus sp. MBLB3053]MDS9468044.1 hypothetical protein [Paracoccus sp. MBLB3053]
MPRFELESGEPDRLPSEVLPMTDFMLSPPCGCGGGAGESRRSSRTGDIAEALGRLFRSAYGP